MLFGQLHGLCVSLRGRSVLSSTSPLSLSIYNTCSSQRRVNFIRGPFAALPARSHTVYPGKVNACASIVWSVFQVKYDALREGM